MDAVEKLNIQILSQYEVTIIAIKSVIENDIETGEGKIISQTEIQPETYYTIDDDIEEDLSEFILDYIQNVGEMKEITLEDLDASISDFDDNENFWVTSLRTSENKTVTEENFERCEVGKENIFVHDLTLSIHINGSNITTRLLRELMFETSNVDDSIIPTSLKVMA